MSAPPRNGAAPGPSFPGAATNRYNADQDVNNNVTAFVPANASDDAEDDFYGDLDELFPDELVEVDPKYVGRDLHHVWFNIPVTDEIRAWVAKLMAADPDGRMCEGMEWAVNKHAGRGGREGQLSGTLLVIGRNYDGHRGLATAIDLLWSIRAKEHRGFQRMLEGARAKVLQNNRGRPRKASCTCDLPKTKTPPVRPRRWVSPPLRRGAPPMASRTVRTP